MSIWAEVHKRIHDIIVRSDKRPETLELDHEDYWLFIEEAREKFANGPWKHGLPPTFKDCPVLFEGVRIVNKG